MNKSKKDGFVNPALVVDETLPDNFIFTSEPYEPIGRYLLKPQFLKQGEFSHIIRDVASKAWVVPKRGTIPTSLIEAETLVVPTVELAVRPIVKDHELQYAPMIKERGRVRSHEAMHRLEDNEVFKVINAAIPNEHQIKTRFFNHQSLIDAFTCIADHELKAGLIVMSHGQFNQMLEWNHKDFTKNNTKRRSEYINGVTSIDEVAVGWWRNVPILVSSMMPKKKIFVLARREYVGVMPIVRDIVEEEVRESQQLRSGYNIYSEVGFGVINDYACASIVTECYLFSDCDKGSNEIDHRNLTHGGYISSLELDKITSGDLDPVKLPTIEHPSIVDSEADSMPCPALPTPPRTFFQKVRTCWKELRVWWSY